MATFITLTSRATKSGITINADLVTTFRGDGVGVSLWMVDDEGEFHFTETPEEVRGKIITEQDRQNANFAVILREWGRGRS